MWPERPCGAGRPGRYRPSLANHNHLRAWDHIDAGQTTKEIFLTPHQKQPKTAVSLRTLCTHSQAASPPDAPGEVPTGLSSTTHQGAPRTRTKHTPATGQGDTGMVHDHPAGPSPWDDHQACDGGETRPWCLVDTDWSTGSVGHSSSQGRMGL